MYSAFHLPCIPVAGFVKRTQHGQHQLQCLPNIPRLPLNDSHKVLLGVLCMKYGRMEAVCAVFWLVAAAFLDGVEARS